jgi:hypothetical protein
VALCDLTREQHRRHRRVAPQVRERSVFHLLNLLQSHTTRALALRGGDAGEACQPLRVGLDQCPAAQRALFQDEILAQPLLVFLHALPLAAVVAVQRLIVHVRPGAHHHGAQPTVGKKSFVAEDNRE